MKLHLCCNCLRGLWEVRNTKEEVIFDGTLEQCQIYINQDK